jgi:isoamylase
MSAESPLLPGSSFLLGAVPDQGGTNFAVYSSVAEDVELCVFAPDGSETRHSLPGRDADVWHGYLPGAGPGLAYGFRVSGPYEPDKGLRCNPAKLLLDPYARAISGSVSFGPEVLGNDVEAADLPSRLDSAAHVPRSLVVDPTFSWGHRKRPRVHLADSVVYELHVKGFTERNPAVPDALRGTYAGLAHPGALSHLLDLGVTAVELLPVHHSVPEAFLVADGRTNYWGYNSVGYFAPHAGYSSEVRAGRPAGQVAEFQSMVKALHDADLEVWLDVVYNHTAEAGRSGPTMCLRGLDNAAYYRLDPADPSEYVDTTGTGNSLNAGHPTCLRMIMDSLRYWVTEMGVDGFRFDLAATLARQDGGFDEMSAFFDLVAQDPVVSQVKLVAEPWDVGQGDSYDVGRFPPGWSEWNGRFRDTVRDFWRSHDGLAGEVARRITGSADLYAASRRGPHASVNLVTVHDGFTLRDLVSYDTKHNEANGEGNRDGTDDNRSWNCGAEGPTDQPDVLALRDRQSRAMLATLLLSHGVPLLLGGDDLRRSQQGNNNAYSQDNEISWWDWSGTDRDLLEFTRRLVALRRGHPVFRRRRYPEADALCWFGVSGSPLTPQEWSDPSAKSFALVLDGSVDPDPAEDGTLLTDGDFALLVNAWWEPLDFAVPWAGASTWRVLVDTYDPTRAQDAQADRPVVVSPRSLVVMGRT